jgi:hypothetical protein
MDNDSKEIIIVIIIKIIIIIIQVSLRNKREKTIKSQLTNTNQNVIKYRLLTKYNNINNN